MKEIESQIFSFVIKIWIEEESIVSGNESWRGRITHIPSGDEKYFRDLSIIVPIIKSYISALDTETDHTQKGAK
ncbi:MAG: hypothetical protein DWQ04_04225 [Chloroflexi bacterium]|nr:MAG: hypothetical protein DWQ04_04225 [Chloroflexota bacterium]